MSSRQPKQRKSLRQPRGAPSQAAAPEPAPDQHSGPLHLAPPAHPTARPLRYARLRRLQRSRGNQQTQNALGQTVQRDDPTYEAGATTYQPEILTINSDLTLPIGDQEQISFDVLNDRAAPRGTTFHMGGGLVDIGGELELRTTRSKRRGRQLDVTVRGNRPGAAEVGGMLQHQVPGGPETFTPAPSASVTVPRPSLSAVAMQKRGADGTLSADTERLKVGDALVVRVLVDNVSERRTDYSHALQIGGPGYGKSLRVEDSDLVEPGVWELTLRATGIGPATLEIGVQPGDTPDDEAVKAEVSTHVEMGKERFLQLCGQVNTEIDLADRVSRAWMLSLARAYGAAWKNHTDTLKAQDESNRLVEDLILNAALAFIPGGVGGVIGGALKNAKRGDFIVDGVKDLAKFGLRRAGAELAPGSDSGLTAFPTDPLEWQNSVDQRLSEEMAFATRQLRDWEDKANGANPDFFLDFNPVEAMRASLEVNGQPAQELQPEDIAARAIDFEKGFWSGWLEQYAYIVASRVTRGGDMYYSARENLGKKIEKRCAAIGLDIGPYVQAARERARAEASRRNAF